MMKILLSLFSFMLSVTATGQTYNLWMIDKNGTEKADSFYKKQGVSDSVYKLYEGNYLALRKPRYDYIFSLQNHAHSYNDLSDKPTIPTNTNELTNGANFISSATAAATYQPIGNYVLQSTTVNGQALSGNIVTSENLLAYQALGSSFKSQTVDFPLAICNTASSLTDNQLRITATYLPTASTITGIKVYVRTAGNYTGDQNNRIGLYSYSAGTLTLVASSANNSTLWTSSANAIQTIPFSSSYSAAAGIYFVGILYNNSTQTTAPALASGTALNNAAMAGTAFGFTNSAKLFGTVSAVNDLPATILMSSVTASTAPTWFALYQ